MKSKAELKDKKQRIKEKLKARALARKTKKQFSRSKLIAEADRVFSLYIRWRDQWKPCCTCWTAWSDTFQSWHFMSRRHLQTRWTAHNAHGQCFRCNMFLSWEQYAHWQFIAWKYWFEFPWLIRSLAESSHKVQDSEILETIQHYYKLCFELGIDYKPKKQFLWTSNT